MTFHIFLCQANKVLTNHITEATARLPFAMLNFAGLFALFLLGWRMFGPLVGLDGGEVGLENSPIDWLEFDTDGPRQLLHTDGISWSAIDLITGG